MPVDTKGSVSENDLTSIDIKELKIKDESDSDKLLMPDAQASLMSVIILAT